MASSQSSFDMDRRVIPEKISKIIQAGKTDKISVAKINIEEHQKNIKVDVLATQTYNLQIEEGKEVIEAKRDNQQYENENFVKECVRELKKDIANVTFNLKLVLTFIADSDNSITKFELSTECKSDDSEVLLVCSGAKRIEDSVAQKHSSTALVMSSTTAMPSSLTTIPSSAVYDNPPDSLPSAENNQRLSSPPPSYSVSTASFTAGSASSAISAVVSASSSSAASSQKSPAAVMQNTATITSQASVTKASRSKEKKNDDKPSLPIRVIGNLISALVGNPQSVPSSSKPCAIM